MKVKLSLCLIKHYVIMEEWLNILTSVGKVFKMILQRDCRTENFTHFHVTKISNVVWNTLIGYCV
jgi:hypothetical protein